MKKLVYLFVMVAGITLTSYSVNAKDPKKAPEPVKKEATAACSKAGEKAMEGKSCDKGAVTACAGKDASQKVSDNKSACCMSKSASTASETKGTKVTK